jgi:hypothetical protein
MDNLLTPEEIKEIERQSWGKGTFAEDLIQAAYSKLLAAAPDVREKVENELEIFASAYDARINDKIDTDIFSCYVYTFADAIHVLYAPLIAAAEKRGREEGMKRKVNEVDDYLVFNMPMVHKQLQYSVQWQNQVMMQSLGGKE